MNRDAGAHASTRARASTVSMPRRTPWTPMADPPPGWLVAVIKNRRSRSSYVVLAEELGAAVDGEPASDGNRSDDIE